MNKELYIKFLNNHCTTEELDEVVKWVHSGAFREESRSWGFENWKSFEDYNGIQDDKRFSELFDKIRDQINKEKKIVKIKKVMITWMSRAAAILFIPLLSILLITISEKKSISGQFSELADQTLEVISPVSSRIEMQLPDGTKVHLNSGSKLTYPQVFSGETREVTLAGEGYFEVAHNHEKPFVVNAGKFKVKALGTKFNIMAYSDVDIIETTLLDGKVLLEQNLPQGQTKTLGAMVPGQHVSINLKTGKINSSKGDVEKYIAWKDGKMIFKDTPITEIAQKLMRKYNVEIEVEDQVQDYYYTVTFFDEPLLQILDLMKIATPISYKLLPRKKLPDGSYSKQKIIIESKKK